MAKKRRRFGYVRKLPSGRWQASYRHVQSGERVAASETFKTKTAAEHWLVDIEAMQRRGDLPDLQAGRMAFEQWANHWLDTRHVRAKTRRGYQSILANHVLPYFGSTAIGNIDRRKVSAFLADLAKQGTTEGTLANIRRVLSMVMNEAARSGAIARNPTDGVRVKRSRRDEMVFLSREQVSGLAQAITNPVVPCGKGFHRPQFPEYGLLVRFVSETGLRAGELAALRVGRVDIGSRRIHVVASATEVPTREAVGGLIYEETKTYENRSVPLPASLAQEPAQHLKTRPTDPDAFVLLPQMEALFATRTSMHATSVEQSAKPSTMKVSHWCQQKRDFTIFATLMPLC